MSRSALFTVRPFGRLPRLLGALALVGAVGTTLKAQAVVRYDGRRLVQGVQLLQSYADSTAFYYLPQYPRLAMRPDSTFEFVVLKYVGLSDSMSGGLFHALVEFSLPPDVIEGLERELHKELPQARIVGMVPLAQASQTGEDAMGGFQIVSATLGDVRTGGLTRTVVTSGKAPLMPGSKAAVAALLRPQGATLLWNSLTGTTSDVSVAIHAFYEAVTDAYNAKVTADMTTIYKHFSLISNVQKDYTRRQIRNVVDDLKRDGTLNVEVLDRTAGTGISAKAMEGVLSLVTDKLTELMFDHTAGWSADPQREAAVEGNQLLGRQQEGFFAQLFGGGDTKYYTDNQFVLKNRTDIRQNTFTLVLSQRGTVKVPVDAAGNLGGLYAGLGDRDRYFRIVDMSDPAFQTRPVHFQVDGEFVDAFRDLINSVAVSVRKSYPDNPAFTKQFEIASGDVIKDGKTLVEVVIPRLGVASADWGNYEYQVRWNLHGGPRLLDPPVESGWTKSGDAAVSLSPPLERHVVEIDADRQRFKEKGIATAVVQFATVLAGTPQRARQVTLRVGDTEPTTRIVLYHDRRQPIAYRVTWFGPDVQQREDAKVLTADYLYLSPPEHEAAAATDAVHP
ncbi:MAG TPA: hypothetical protein VEM13_01980 [Gemmatimonadales bacterium]|nr:hypothetical protein [Gemmatimonadales bacterium]